MKYAQYRKDTGLICATNSIPLTGEQLAAFEASGKGQIAIDSALDISRYKINLDTLQPEELPPPPPPPLETTDHVFIAMVKKGEIDITEVDDRVLERLNRSLKHTGKAELKKA